MHRDALIVNDGIVSLKVPLRQVVFDISLDGQPTVGDWLLLNGATSELVRMLNRQSVFRRARAHSRSEYQPLAANIDFLFVLSSCSDEFNEARLDRYLVTANQCDLVTVLVLTKRDLCDDVEHYLARAKVLPLTNRVVPVNARERSALTELQPYFANNNTVAVVGSSGVGKSTLVNSLMSSSIQKTQSLRSDRVRGRHTTSSRTLLRIPSGGLLIDVPGMREFGLVDGRASIDKYFSDIVALEHLCRFANCHHDTEAECAIKLALGNNELDIRRFNSYQKLVAEERERSQSRLERSNFPNHDQRNT